MISSLTTREKLRINARQQFWSKGYSNVSVRQIAKLAGVDVALISRYFGGKLGLFKATLDGAFDLADLPNQGEDILLETFLNLFIMAPRDGDAPSAMRMLLTNAHDDDVGPLVRTEFQNSFHANIVTILGSEARAALFMTVLLGVSVAEKTLHLPGIGAPSSKAYERQLRYLLQAALDFNPQAEG